MIQLFFWRIMFAPDIWIHDHPQHLSTTCQGHRRPACTPVSWMRIPGKTSPKDAQFVVAVGSSEANIFISTWKYNISIIFTYMIPVSGFLPHLGWKAYTYVTKPLVLFVFVSQVCVFSKPHSKGITSSCWCFYQNCTPKASFKKAHEATVSLKSGTGNTERLQKKCLWEIEPTPSRSKKFWPMKGFF